MIMQQDPTFMSEARRLAATSPAAKTTTHDDSCRGLGGENDMGHHLARINSPASKYEGCYLARRTVAIQILFWLCMAIGALSIGAQLTGHAETLRAMWHQTP
ncbi:hypothetical protein METH_06715 [Leisingera methylohalidivorans DSM 14336]|uniref:Uncharacterized protein n=1 Tax=Leisingera methylohalidivorans DSM 14336 TaxID=999552 RepID=V9VZX7_9RHOB|nr:hypothetical protein METH_06715 [Leisingera methylohalidivorans DSM 14336]